MNKIAWALLLALAIGLAIQLLSAPVQSQESTKIPFVGITYDGKGRWAALRANGEVYLSAGDSWLDRMEYRYTIQTLEDAYSSDD